MEEVLGKEWEDLNTKACFWGKFTGSRKLFVELEANFKIVSC
jgi:hypothetical protein